jgi:hypothetical protein
MSCINAVSGEISSRGYTTSRGIAAVDQFVNRRSSDQPQTIARWLEILERIYAVFRVPPFGTLIYLKARFPTVDAWQAKHWGRDR